MNKRRGGHQRLFYQKTFGALVMPLKGVCGYTTAVIHPHHKLLKGAAGCALAILLTIAIGATPAYLMGCQFVCSQGPCKRPVASRSMAGMSNTRRGPACCQNHHRASGAGHGSPCGAPVRACARHVHSSSFRAAMTPSLAHPSPNFATSAVASVMNETTTIESHSPAPPGYRTGRSICRSGTLLRV